MSLTLDLAECASRLRRSAITDLEIASTVDLITDHVGVSLRGWTEPWTTIVRTTALQEGAAPAAALYDGSRTSVRNAALVNGAAGHALELDDTHDRSLTHPGAVVIPAALALGQGLRRSGPEVLQSIVAGYEVQCRLGMVLGQKLIERGMHPTATLGVFGATAAAGNLHRLDVRRMTWAFGIAASMSAGTMQFSQDTDGTMVKRLYGGLPAERGVLAATWAAQGLTGPQGAIEGPFGIAAMLANVTGPLQLRMPGEERAERAERAEGFEIGRVSIKLYPCCKNFHALIEAAAILRSRRSFQMDDLAEVHVFGPRAMVEHHLELAPRSTMAAQYSLPFTTAVALIDDPSTPEAFGESARARPDLLALASRVVPHIDVEFSRLFPAHFGGGVVLKFRDGSVLEERVLDCSGTPANPVDRGAVERKFRRMTSAMLSEARQDIVLSAIHGLDRAASLSTLVAALDASAVGAAVN